MRGEGKQGRRRRRGVRCGCWKERRSRESRRMCVEEREVLVSEWLGEGKEGRKDEEIRGRGRRRRGAGARKRGRSRERRRMCAGEKKALRKEGEERDGKGKRGRRRRSVGCWKGGEEQGKERDLCRGCGRREGVCTVEREGWRRASV